VKEMRRLNRIKILLLTLRIKDITDIAFEKNKMMLRDALIKLDYSNWK
jgi:hypothetical protein